MNILDNLSKSKFRSKFHLSQKDKGYINDKGLEKIESHARDFVNKNLKIKLVKDGKQTPFKGHPVFIAQHATATCCRECISKWHKITTERDMTDDDVNYVVSIIMEFIKKDYSL
jgi:hypothetical protein